MDLTSQQSTWPTVQALLDEADALRGVKRDTAQAGATEEALRAAHRKVASDLNLFAKNAAAKVPTNYDAVFGDQLQEKTAAILLLAKYTILDLASFPREILDIERAHGNLAVFAETLFRTQAVDGLIELYNFTVRNAQTPSSNPRVWQNVAAHCLMLLTLMEAQRQRVITFLAQTPSARRQMEQLISFTRPNLISMLLKESAPEHNTTLPPTADIPPYLRLLDRLDPGLPLASAKGVCSYIFAQHRIEQLFAQQDFTPAQRWFIEGSLPAASEVLRQTHALPSRTQREFLEDILTIDNVHPLRIAAIMRELGESNRSDRPDGGIGETNRLLYETATTQHEELTLAAQIAVNELGSVKNYDALLAIAQDAPLQSVAEYAVTIMKEHRRLLMLQQVLAKRPSLVPAYRKAQAELQEIEKIMEMVWVCDDQEMVQLYVQRLQGLKAYPELERIHKLVQKKNKLAGTFSADCI